MLNLPFKFFSGFAKADISCGIDIGTASIKAVKLKLNKGSVELLDYKLEPVAVNFAVVLKNMSRELQVSHFNLTLAGSSPLIRYITLPKMAEAELKQALKFEAQKHIPFNLVEVSLDSFILKDNLPDNKMLVLLAAAKKEFIAEHVKTIEDCGLKVDMLDIDSLALVNAFNFSNSGQAGELNGKATALLNIGGSISNLNILEGGIPQFSRDIHLAGKNITQKISDMLGVEFNIAEEVKLNPGKEQLNKVTAAMDSVFSGLAAEIRTSFDYYETQSSSSVTKIFLSGGSSLLAGVKEKLANLLGLEVEFWDTLRSLSIAPQPNLESIRPLASQFAVAIGLALRR